MSRLMMLLTIVGLAVTPLAAWEITADICGPSLSDEAEAIHVLPGGNVLVAGRCREYGINTQIGPLYLATFSPTGSLRYHMVFDSMNGVVGNQRPMLWLLPVVSSGGHEFWIAYREGGVGVPANTKVLKVFCDSLSCTVQYDSSLTASLQSATVDRWGNLYLVSYLGGSGSYIYRKLSPSGSVEWEWTDSSTGSVYLPMATDSLGNLYVAQSYGVNHITLIRGFSAQNGQIFWEAEPTGGYPVDIEIHGNYLYGINRDANTLDPSGEDILLFRIRIGDSTRDWVVVHDKGPYDRPSDMIVQDFSIKVYGKTSGNLLFGSFTVDGRGGSQVWTQRIAYPPNVDGYISHDQFLVHNPYDRMFYAGAFAFDSTDGYYNYLRPMVVRYSGAGTVYRTWLASQNIAWSASNHNVALAVDSSSGYVYATTLLDGDLWLMQIPPYIPICRKCQMDRLQPGDGAISLSSLNRSGERFVVFDPVGRALGVFEGKDLAKKLGRGLFWLQPLTHEGKASSRRLRLVIP